MLKRNVQMQPMQMQPMHANAAHANAAHVQEHPSNPEYITAKDADITLKDANLGLSDHKGCGGRRMLLELRVCSCVKTVAISSLETLSSRRTHHIAIATAACMMSPANNISMLSSACTMSSAWSVWS